MKTREKITVKWFGDSRFKLLEFSERTIFFCFAYIAVVKRIGEGTVDFELVPVSERIEFLEYEVDMYGRLMKELPKRKEYFGAFKIFAEKEIRFLRKHLYANRYGHYNGDETSTWD